MRLLLVGNYGVGNAGDEILKEYFLKRFPGVEWIIVSASPAKGELHRFPAGLRSFIAFRWLRTVRALRASDGLVFGGGSLFTDVESPYACFVWAVQAWFARLLGKPYYLAFQGIGPFRTGMGERWARNVVRHATFISVRDEASFDRLMGREACPASGKNSLGEVWKKNTKVIQTFDPSLCLLEKKNMYMRTQNLFIVIPRLSPMFVGSLKGIREALQGKSVLILSLQPADERERTLCRELATLWQASVLEVTTLEMAVSALHGAACVITQRYHGAIAALTASVPFIALPFGKGDKLDALARECGCPSRFAQDTDWDSLRKRLSHMREVLMGRVTEGERMLKKALGVCS